MRAGRTQGVVLSGGGGYAAYELGVLRALAQGESPAVNYEHVEPRVVTGTSAGAFNVSLLCSVDPDASTSAGLDYMEDVWVHGVAGEDGCGNNVIRFRANPLTLGNACSLSGRGEAEWAEDVDFLSRQLSARTRAFLGSSAELKQRVAETLDISLVLSSDRFVELIRDVVDPANMRACARALRVAATNWRTGDVRVFENEDMTDERAFRIVLASTATPAIFPTIEIDGEPYADGALVMNTPLQPAIEAGAETLHVIYMDPRNAEVPLARLRSTSSTLYRVAVIAWASMMNRDIEIARRINRGIDVLEGRVTSAADDEFWKAGHLVAAQQALTDPAERYRHIEIHRYHPHERADDPLRWMEFGRDQILRLIDRGYEDAVNHDCRARDCLVEGL
jgi:NTE family protein